MTKSSLLIALLATSALIISACDSEIDGKSAAQVGEAQEEVADEEDDTVETRELTFDTEQSAIEWVGAKVTGDHDGGFEDWEGTATLRDGELHRLAFTVDTTSIFSDDPDLTDHLKSDDFFSVDEYPEATFRSTNIEPKATDDGTHEITGNFTIRDITNGVTFPATVELDEDSLQANTEFTIQRFDFGIEYKGQADNLIRDEVLLKIDLSAS